MKIKLSSLRYIIRESINTWHANYHTKDNMPYGYEDYPGVDVEQTMDANSGAWSVIITCTFDDSLSEPVRVFKTEEDASAYSKKKSEELHNIWLQTQN